MPGSSQELKTGLVGQSLWEKQPAKAERLSGLSHSSLIRADYTSRSCTSPSSCSLDSSSSGDFEEWRSSTSFHKSTAADGTTKPWDPADSKASTKPSPPVPWWFRLRSPARFGPWAQPSGPDLTALLDYNQGKKCRCPYSRQPAASACPLSIPQQTALDTLCNATSWD